MNNKNFTKVLVSLIFVASLIGSLAIAEKIGTENVPLNEDARKIGTPEGLQYTMGIIEDKEQTHRFGSALITQEDHPEGSDVDALKSKSVSALKSPQVVEAGALDEKKIYPGDVLKIIVYPQENLSASRSVDKDGNIFFPYVGNIQAAGMTLDEFEKYLTKILEKDYLEYPRIFVSREVSVLEQWRAGWRDAHVKPVLIYGEGGATSYYPTREGVTLLEVMSQRGGFAATADAAHVRIVRLVDGRLQNLFVNAWDIIEGRITDVPLNPGDIVYIPGGYVSEGNPGFIHIFGEVNRPGPFPFQQLGDKPTLVIALSIVGGFTRIAAPNRVRIVRVVNDKETKIKVNAKKILKGEEKDVVLQPGDIVIIPESYW